MACLIRTYKNTKINNPKPNLYKQRSVYCTKHERIMKGEHN